MSGDAQHAAPPPLHSVFLSYASADRAAARALREVLAAAGLEVWLDEEELAGGEAWDAKIRHQIRTCTYFMPLISATTEKRREGYFRREWRLAVERTLDQADDVLFLVPVVIDDTRDAGARVPERFFSVQWLRAPGGAATPELRELAARLARGDTHAAPRSVEIADEPAPRRPKRKSGAPPPPFPHFPAYPEKGHATRFLYNIVLWAGHMVHALWLRLPRAVQVIASIVILFNLISWIFRENSQPTLRRDSGRSAAEVPQNFAKAGTADPDDKPAEEVVKSLVNAAAHAFQSGRPLAIVTFGGPDEEAKAFAANVSGEVFRLLLGAEDVQASISPIPLDAADEEGALARGASLESHFVLTGHAQRASPGEPLLLTTKIYDVRTKELVWSETFDATQNDAPTAARGVLKAVRQHIGPPAPPPPQPDR